jgi:putative DNA primase/helicase
LDQAEEPAPVDGGTMKQSASEIDAVPEAAAFLAQTERDGVPRLRFWRGTWLDWRQGAYRELPPSEVRGRLVDYLDQGYFRLTQSAVGNVVEGLRAKARLPHHIDPPAWLGEDKPDWNPGDVLVCRNGLVHLASLVGGQPEYMRPATPRLFATAAVDYDFRVDAPRPDAWLTFLSQLWPDDPESISALQEWTGYLLTPDTSQQKIMLVIGPRRSGKGTIARVLTALVGKANVCGPTLASLSTNFGLWPLVGKSLAIVSDARLGGRTDSQIAVERLLSISGEDALTIDRKNLEPLTTKLPTRLLVFSNELPRLGDSSGALAGRMVLLRLSRSFYGCEDTALTDKLLAELPGILLWAVEGWRRLRERGRFVQPTAADELMAELHDLSSPVGAFLRDCCNVGPEYEAPRADLYEAYTAWAKQHGRQHVEDETGFGRALRAALSSVTTIKHRIDGQHVRFYGGVGLR